MTNASTILVVDDDPTKRYTIAHLMRHAGYRTLEAASAHEALGELANAPALAILDINLPDLSGWELCRRIKADPRTSSTIVLHTSGIFREASDRARGLDNGADGYLMQPIQPEELIAYVRAMLRLRQAETALRQSNATLERFAYVAAHDLREPLRMVGCHLDLLKRRAGTSLDQRCHGYLEQALEGVGRMDAMINGLLALSRIQAQTPEVRSVAAGEALAAALASLHLRIAESGAVIRHGDLPEVLADRSQLEQLFQNLIGNAIKYRGAQPPEIAITCHDLPEVWQFGVADNGPGIAAEQQERIFQPFTRVHRGGEGSGLGLALCQSIVQQHGGRIWVESEPGAGATFRFTLAKDARAHGSGFHRVLPAPA